MNEVDYLEMYRFLNGEMNTEEQQVFEHRIQEDAVLKEEVNFHQNLLLSMELSGDQLLRNSIAQAESKAYQNGHLFTEGHINRYLKQELDQKDAAIFERRLQTDEAFATEVNFHQDLQIGIDLAGDRHLKDQISSVTAQMEEQSQQQVATNNQEAKRVRLFSRRNLAIAASFLLLITASYFLFRTDNGLNTTYANHFQIDQQAVDQSLEQLELIGMAISDKERRANLSTALQLFQSKEYTKASSALSTHLDQYPNDDLARYYYGLNLMQLENFKLANQELLPLTEKEAFDKKLDAQWYLGLSYLQLAEQEKAMTIFNELSKTPSYSEKANKILIELNKK